MSANDRQHGGSHYRDAAKDGEQHWDRMWRLYGEAWFVGNITKYVERYKLKNGVEDLEKARHYLDKLIELETPASATATSTKPAVELNDMNRCNCGPCDVCPVDGVVDKYDRCTREEILAAGIPVKEAK